MPAKKTGPSVVTNADGQQVDTRSGEVLDGTFGDEATDLSEFAQEDAPPKAKAAFTKAQLAALADAEDPLALLAEMASVDEIATVNDVLSDGTTIVDKAMLINKPFCVVTWRFHESTQHKGKSFCAVRCMDLEKPAGAPGRSFIFTDGGVGIYEQLAMFQLKNNNETVPMMAPYGLSPSKYEWKNEETGEEGVGTTYYFAQAPVKP